MASGVLNIIWTSGTKIVNVPVLPEVQVNPMYFETKDLDLGDGSQLKGLEAMFFEIEGAGSFDFMTLKVGYRDRLSEVLVWESFTGLAPDEPIYPDIEARFFRFRLEDTLALTRWKLSAIECYGEMLEGDIT